MLLREELNWLDDHSRYLLSCTAHGRDSGPDVIASRDIDPDHNYWPNKQKNPGKPGQSVTHDPTHV